MVSLPARKRAAGLRHDPCGLLITLTGILEIAGTIALQIPRLDTFAATGLFLMLTAIFPANVFAARYRLQIGGRPVPALLPRTLIQIAFLAALWARRSMKGSWIQPFSRAC